MPRDLLLTRPTFCTHLFLDILIILKINSKFFPKPHEPVSIRNREPGQGVFLEQKLEFKKKTNIFLRV